jgi:hypothetical protein
MHPPGTLIVTEHGYRPIELINVGDFILSGNGNWRRVEDTFRKEFAGGLVSVNLPGTNRNQFLDGETLVFAAPNKHVNTLDWVKASDLTQSHYLVIPKPALPSSKVLNLGDFFYQFTTVEDKIRNHRGQTLPAQIPLNFDSGRFFGYIIARGNIDDEYVDINFHLKEQNFADDFLRLLRICFPNMKVETTTVRGSVTITVRSAIFAHLVRSMFERNKRTKRKSMIRQFQIPNFIWATNEDFVRGVTAGLVNGCGEYKKDAIIVRHQSRKYVMDVRMMLLSIGITSSICKHSKKGWTSCKIMGNSISAIYSMCGKKKNNINDVRYATKYLAHPKIRIVNNFCVARIRGISTIKYNGQLYGLKTGPDGSYVSHFEIRGTT